MTDEKNSVSQNDQNKVKKLQTPFKKVQFFNSFEEQEQEELKWLATQTPQQHLEHTVSLIKRVFAEELKQHPRIGNQLHIN